MSASVSKTFTRWTEEERRAHRRKQNATYQARKVEHLTPREKQVNEEERRKRQATKQATKQAMEQGEWVATAKVEKKEQKEAKTKVATKNGFAAFDSDSEEEVKETKTVWGQKIDWAADSDDE
jgi:ribonuclease BN (tRNA processing enzyme)